MEQMLLKWSKFRYNNLLDTSPVQNLGSYDRGSHAKDLADNLLDSVVAVAVSGIILLFKMRLLTSPRFANSHQNSSSPV